MISRLVGQREDARRGLFDRLLADLAPDERRFVLDGVARLEQAADALG